MGIVGVSKFILGFVVAIALLGLAGLVASRYVMTQISTLPARPVYANDPSPSSAGAAPSSVTSSIPSAEASPAVSPIVSPTEGYIARVTQPVGLILRQEPSAESAETGGIEFNQELTVLSDSPDGAWQRVRLTDGSEGWVKGGNTERLN